MEPPRAAGAWRGSSAVSRSLVWSRSEIRKRFTVKGRPVVSIQNVANGRIEVKSAKTQEVVVSGSQLSNKIGVETEQADDRIDVTASVWMRTLRLRNSKRISLWSSRKRPSYKLRPRLA